MNDTGEATPSPAWHFPCGIPADRMIDSWVSFIGVLGYAPGSTGDYLLALIGRADPQVRHRLRLGFPLEVAAWEAFSGEQPPLPAAEFMHRLSVIRLGGFSDPMIPVQAPADRLPGLIDYGPDDTIVVTGSHPMAWRDCPACGYTLADSACVLLYAGAPPSPSAWVTGGAVMIHATCARLPHASDSTAAISRALSLAPFPGTVSLLQATGALVPAETIAALSRLAYRILAAYYALARALADDGLREDAGRFQAELAGIGTASAVAGDPPGAPPLGAAESPETDAGRGREGLRDPSRPGG